ncbi:MAG: carboxymuconolactone decarboxylase family protein [Acidobacteriaceae bacterium]
MANILKIHSLAPDVLTAHLQIYQAAMHASGELSRTQREMIAVAVSAANGCHY